MVGGDQPSERFLLVPSRESGLDATTINRRSGARAPRESESSTHFGEAARCISHLRMEVVRPPQLRLALSHVRSAESSTSS
jgi:hypothetical protein